METGASTTSEGTASAQIFVGRRTELDVVGRLIPRTVRSGGWSVTITGPAGIGKTRLVAEAARSPDSNGTAVFWGRCSEEARDTPYWPWVQIIRRLRGEPRGGTDLARLVLGGPAEGDRLELFEATATLIEDRALVEPLVLVLDDIHLADAASFLLTRFLCRRLRESAVLIITTLRTSTALDDEQAERVAALDEAGIVIELAGLEADDVTAAFSTTVPVDDILAATGGNPLLVQHAIYGHTTPGELGVRLGDILGQRIGSTSPATRKVIGTLGVVGSGWTIDQLAEITDMTSGDVRAAVEQGRKASLLVEVDDRVEVAHALVAQAGSDDIDDAARSALHRRAAALLIAPDHLSARAAQLLRGGPTVLLEAIDIVEQCAQRALDALAPESTINLLHQALDLLTDVASDGIFEPDELAVRRVDLLVLLGDATWRAGHRDLSATSFETARSIAITLGDARRVARATLGGGVQYDFHGDRTGEITRRLQASLDDFDDDADPMRARLLAMLAMKLIPIDPATARVTAIDALKAADTAGDPIALGHAMIADQLTLLGPSTLNRRIESAHQILAIGHEHNHPDLLVQGRFLLLGALLERGDIRALDVELATQERTLEELADATLVRHSLWFRCTRALLRGATADAEALAEECLAVTLTLGDPDGIVVYGGQITLIRWMQNRLGETEQLYLDLQAEEPHDPLWPAVLGFMWAHAGALDAARGALAMLPPLDQIEDGQHWLLTMCAVAETTAIAGTDAQRAAVREQLLPYADRVVPVGMGASLWGTAARPLGLIARSLGDWSAAVEHLRGAINTAARLGARPWLIEAQLDLAMVLSESNGDPAEIGRLVGEATRSADRLGLAHFIERAAEFATPAQSGDIAGATTLIPTMSPSVDLVPSAAPTGRLTVTVCGGFEVLLTGGPAQWPSRKSRLLFRILVARRGRPAHREQLADLVWPNDPGGSGRLDVEVSRLRRALDPDRIFGRDEFVVVRDGTVRLQAERFDIDIENILRAADRISSDPDSVQTSELRALCAHHTGAAFAEDAYADWASPMRDATNTAICVLYRTLAERQVAAGQSIAAASSLRSVLAVDEYDAAAHQALITLLESSGSHGLAADAAGTFATAIRELGVELPPRSDPGGP